MLNKSLDLKNLGNILSQTPRGPSDSYRQFTAGSIDIKANNHLLHTARTLMHDNPSSIKYQTLMNNQGSQAGIYLPHLKPKNDLVPKNLSLLSPRRINSTANSPVEGSPRIK